MGVSRRMLLWLEKGVKVPERTLDVVIRGHLGKSHFKEDLAIFGPHFEQWMKVTSWWLNAEGFEIVRLEFGRLPSAGSDHVWGQIRLRLFNFRSEVATLSDDVRLDSIFL